MRTSKSVKSSVTDPRLVEERRLQILQAAVKLFSKKGYYRTTILDIARKAGISSGLIYQYFQEKDDVLYLALMMVLETYEREIPPKVDMETNPVDRLCAALRAYCRVVDSMREATVLAYRSTKSLPMKRRRYVLDGEARTNEIILECLRDCIANGDMKPVNEELMVYQYVMFSHAWALKHWAFRDNYSVSNYVDEGISLLVEPFLTRKGRAALQKQQRRK